MKAKQILSTAIILLFALFAKAQDTTLPQGKVSIQLYSGKVIKNVRLRSINTIKIEYIKDGNLCDAKINDVQKMETSGYLLTFNDEKKLVKREYDLIVIYYQDTTQCIIEKINPESITFIPAGKENKRTILNSYVQKYLQRKNIPGIADEWQTPGKIKQTEKIASAPVSTSIIKSNNIISSNIVTKYTNNRNTASNPNKDLIITVKGDSIRCTIDRSSNYLMVYYHIRRHGPDPKGHIPASEIISIGTPPEGFKNKNTGRHQFKGGAAIGIGVFVTLAVILAINSAQTGISTGNW